MSVDGEELYRQVIFNGGNGYDPVFKGKIPTPTRTSTDKYHYHYAG
jgi:hypothetical protein